MGLFNLCNPCRSRIGCSGMRRSRYAFPLVPAPAVCDGGDKYGVGTGDPDWAVPLMECSGPDLAFQAEVALMKGLSDGDTLGLLFRTVLPGMVGMALRVQPSLRTGVGALLSGIGGGVGARAGGGERTVVVVSAVAGGDVVIRGGGDDEALLRSRLGSSTEPTCVVVGGVGMRGVVIVGDGKALLLGELLLCTKLTCGAGVDDNVVAARAGTDRAKGSEGDGEVLRGKLVTVRAKLT